ncbi:hypothetical protein [Streptomyces hirsutus]
MLPSFWHPFTADEEHGYYFGSLLVARPGSYDTSAQAAERLRRSS